MSVNPELGTAPRPDVTGLGKYDNADAFLGINPALIGGASTPWEGIRVEWDFPATKYPPTSYTVEASFHADFEENKLAADRLETGIAGTPTLFNLTFTEFVSTGTGTPTLQCDKYAYRKMIYVRIRATAVGTWSETLMTTLKPVPNLLPPVANFTYVDTALSVVYTDTSVVGAYPIATWAWDFNDGESTSASEDPTYEFAGAGTFPVVLVVTDTQGNSGTRIQQVTVST